MIVDRSTKAVIFDLDGTLYHLPGLRLRMTWRLRGDLRLLRHFSGARGALRGREFGGSAMLDEEFGRELGRRAGVDPRRAVTWYKERFLPEFVSLLARRARFRPGLDEALTLMRSHGLRLGVVSDHAMIDERLVAIGLDPGLFDDLVASEDLGVLKPSPLPFFYLASKWGVEPEAVIVVGDRLDLDAASARAAGMEYLPAGEWRRLHRKLPRTNAEALEAALHGENA